MATADKSDHTHARRQRRDDPTEAVLDHETLVWSNTVLGGGA